MDLALIGLYYLSIFWNFLLYHYSTRYGVGHRCPYGRLKGTFYTICIYTIPPHLAQPRKNGRNHTKNREIRDPYPTPGIKSGF